MHNKDLYIICHMEQEVGAPCVTRRVPVVGNRLGFKYFKHAQRKCYIILCMGMCTYI